MGYADSANNTEANLARASGAVGRLAAPGERTIGDAVGDFLHSDPVEKLTQPFIAESGLGGLIGMVAKEGKIGAFLTNLLSTEKAAEDVVPLIKAGSAGGETAGKAFSTVVKDAAKAENPLSTCVYCRMEGTANQVDHAIPKARGGNATLDNAQMACPHCNASKGARDYPVNPPPGYRGEWPPSHW